jgi:alpha-glucosidase
MKRLRLLCMVSCLAIMNASHAQKEIWLASPDSSILYSFKLSDSTPGYRVLYKNRHVIRYSSLKLAFMEGGDFGVNTRIAKPHYKPIKVDTGIALRFPRPMKNHFNEVLIPIVERGVFQRKVNLRVRAYNNGVAFRFEFPANQAWKNFDLTEEQIYFRLAGTPTINKTVIGEASLGALDPSPAIDQAMVIRIPESNLFVLLSETRHHLQPNLNLLKATNNLLIGTLPELPEQGGVKMKHALPYTGPWRMILIGKDADQLPGANMFAELK